MFYIEHIPIYFPLLLQMHLILPLLLFFSIYYTTVTSNTKVLTTLSSAIYPTKLEESIIYESSAIIFYKMRNVPIGHDNEFYDHLYLKYRFTKCPTNDSHCQQMTSLQAPLYEVHRLISWFRDALVKVDQQRTHYQNPLLHPKTRDDISILGWPNRTSYEVYTDNTSPIFNPHDRKKRGVFNFVGKIENILFGVATVDDLKHFKTNEANIVKYIQSMKENIISNHQAVVREAITVSVLQNQFYRTLLVLKKHIVEMKNQRVWETELYETVAQNLHFIQYSLLLNAHSESLQSCISKRIPIIFIPPDSLRFELTELDKSLMKANKGLAIPIDDIKKYYSLPIASCINTDDYIHITVKVPIVTRDYHWKLYELVRVPLHFNNKTYVLKSLPSFVIKNNAGHILPLSQSDAHRCSPFVNPLCMVTIYSTNLTTENPCLQCVFNGGMAEQLRTCEFESYNSTSPILTPIGINKLAITHPTDDAKIICDEHTQAFGNQEKIGAFIIELACNCKVTMNQYTDLLPLFPCSSNQVNYTIQRIIPPLWSTLDRIQVSSTLHANHSGLFELNQIIDHFWENKSALDDIIYSKPITFPSLVLQEAADSNVFLIIWNAVITIILGFFIYRTHMLASMLALTPPANCLSSHAATTIIQHCKLPLYIEIFINILFALSIIMTLVYIKRNYQRDLHYWAKGFIRRRSSDPPTNFPQ